ncbi:hypothetical protein BLS_006660 [Venturia inaequalis]|uniref:Secreted protein n=1 Tax=Venturia inaequalis TaxID=5025 RepID=A0A8H3UAM3_VENIN|nr:hypothetical protein BLS_006660 [Venturia inaequalis]
MHFQPLLLSILFAHPTSAYACCFEIVGATYYKNFRTVMQSGALQVWRPTGGADDCTIVVDKDGANCKQWKYKIPETATCY